LGRVTRQAIVNTQTPIPIVACIAVHTCPGIADARTRITIVSPPSRISFANDAYVTEPASTRADRSLIRCLKA
jgi:hypothetical protein